MNFSGQEQPTGEAYFSGSAFFFASCVKVHGGTTPFIRGRRRSTARLVVQIEEHWREGMAAWAAVLDATLHRTRPIMFIAAAVECLEDAERRERQRERRRLRVSAQRWKRS